MDQVTDELPREPWTAVDVALYMKLKRNGDRTVRRWAREGLLKCGRVGTRMFFQKSDVDNMLFPKVLVRGVLVRR